MIFLVDAHVPPGRTGNIRARERKSLFAQHLPTIVAALQNNSLVELDRQTVTIVA